MSTAIEFNHVGKQYRLGLVSTKTLSHDLNRWWQMNIMGKEDPYLKIGDTNDRSVSGSSDYVWALRDIDFKIEQGDVVGIIGKNGAGKSTLLKLLSKVTGPTTGSIRARGRIGALLEVGTGFHPEMTGRENIYMNGAIMGMTKSEISRKLEEIVDFSGCERYIDTPVKRYSSGMTVRLGFAVAAHLDPEILVVDEVLAVGDAEFQKKAIGKMQDVSKGEGRTVLFVSHNMASIRALCKSGVLLENGRVKYSGSANDTINLYLQDNSREYEGGSIVKLFKTFSNQLSIDSVKINGFDSDHLTLDYPDRKISVEIGGHHLGQDSLGIECMIYSDDGSVVAKRAQSLVTGSIVKVNQSNFTLKDEFYLPDNLTDGDYYMELQVTHPMIEYLAIAEKAVKISLRGLFTPQGNCLSRQSCGGAVLFL